VSAMDTVGAQAQMGQARAGAGPRRAGQLGRKNISRARQRSLGCIAGLLKLWATRQRWVARPAKLAGLRGGEMGQVFGLTQNGSICFLF
jgi:hypothetical protein